MHRKGFTLLELLIVIGILAVLATVAVLVINPAEYLKQSRDAKRVTDLTALNKALAIAEFSGLNMGGASTTVFVSLVDTVATCTNLALPQLPAGYQYNCITAASSLRKADGTGWVPVNFASLTGGSPLAVLPVDPTNDATKFYTYIPGGSFALSATLESEKYWKEAGATDGGANHAKLEKGSDLKLLTAAEGLVGYWPLDEEGGTVANDASGNGNSGIYSGGITTNEGKLGNGGDFDGVNDYIDLGNSDSIKNITNQISVSVWVKYDAYGGGGQPYSVIAVKGDPWTFLMENPSNKIRFRVTVGGQDLNASDSVTHELNRWYYFVGTYDGQNIKIYKDGALVGTTPATGNLATNDITAKIGTWQGANYNFNGVIDDIRIYKRALPASEIQSMYAATK